MFFCLSTQVFEVEERCGSSLIIKKTPQDKTEVLYDSQYLSDTMSSLQF